MKYLFLLLSINVCFAKPQISIGVFQAKPFAYSEGEHAKGIVPDFLNKMLSSEFDIKFKVLPYIRAIDAIKSDRVDMIIMYPNDKIKDGVLKGCLTLGNDNLIVTNKTKKNDNTLALIRGANYGVEISKEFKRVGVVDYEQSFKLIKAQRVSNIMISSAAWHFYKSQLNSKNYNVTVVNFVQNMLYFRKNFDKNLKEKICKLNNRILKKYPTKKFDDFMQDL